MSFDDANTQLTAYDSDGQLRWALPTGGFEWNPVPPAIGPDGRIYAYTGVQSAPEIIAVTTEGKIQPESEPSHFR
jgi:outer membrane protein assembly factor BamB